MFSHVFATLVLAALEPHGQENVLMDLGLTPGYQLLWPSFGMLTARQGYNKAAEWDMNRPLYLEPGREGRKRQKEHERTKERLD